MKGTFITARNDSAILDTTLCSVNSSRNKNSRCDVKSKQGIFITLEGTEGSGKSVQTALLSNYLKKIGYRVKVTSEPGDTHIGKSIRKLLLDPKNKSLDSITELFLYLADRAQHIKEVIEPSLKKGYIVLCDRFGDATVAYQGYGRKLPIDLIHELNKLATKGIRPDLTILLEIPLRLGLRRAMKIGPYKGDRMEKQKFDFHKRVYRGYMELAKKYPKRIKVIKVRDGIEDTQEKIRELVLAVIRSKN